MSSIGTQSINFTKDEEIVNKLKSKYRSIRESEVSLIQKVDSYSEKIKEIEIENKREIDLKKCETQRLEVQERMERDKIKYISKINKNKCKKKFKK